jgi:acylglycerol lipase
VSRDPAVVQAYINDPLVYTGKITARLAAELLKTIRSVTARIPEIILPIFIVQGGADNLVDPAGAQMLCDRVGSKDKAIKTYDGLYHEIFNEPEHVQVLEDVAKWIDAHLQFANSVNHI